MNIYFLLEGRHTEKKVYPKWISYLAPNLSQINDPFEVNTNQYYVFNGKGFPSLLDNHLKNSIEDINTINKFDYLVICLDSDDQTVQNRTNEILQFIKSNQLELKNSKLFINVQSRCIESWFMGNNKIFSRQPQSRELRRFIKFYNVLKDDPELMMKPNDFNSVGQFHKEYLTELFLEKNLRYSEKKPGVVLQRQYLNQLLKRHEETNHLNTLRAFIDFCSVISNQT